MNDQDIPQPVPYPYDTPQQYQYQESQYQEPQMSFEDQEIERLKQENQQKQEAFDKQREIERLKQENQKIDFRRKEMDKRFNPRFKFSKEKAKFWAIAAVISITAAIVIVKVVQKFI